METFDQSLKYLLHNEPADFIRFGLGDMTVELVEPIPSDLPARGRDVDGGYRVRRDGDELAAHVEFHRRHQKVEELEVDVAEAQVRLFRREAVPVVSQVWDLYGKANDPLLQERTLSFGARALTTGSRAVYVRVNLRALFAEELLSSAPPALWPLVALTRDGAEGAAVKRAIEAIEGRKELGPSARADHLAVLWFVSEAEEVPLRVLREYLTREKLMESVLYKSIFEEGAAAGEARGEARGLERGRKEGERTSLAGLLSRGLMRHLGMLEPQVRKRIRSVKDVQKLDRWCEQLLDVRDAEGAQALVREIMGESAR